jgi:hypothetical protein
VDALTIAIQPYYVRQIIVKFHNSGVAMSGRDEALIGDWENRLHANELAWRILSTLNERKSEVERRAGRAAA